MKKMDIKETTLRDVIAVLFRHKAVIISSFFVIMTTVYIATELRTPVYEAQVKMLLSRMTQRDIRTGGPQDTKDFGFGSPIDTVIEMVTAKPVMERVVNALRLDNRPLDFERRFAPRLKRILIDRSMEKFKSALDKMNPTERQAYLFQNALEQLSGQVEAYQAGETSLFIINVRDFDPEIAVILANSISRSYVIFDLEQQIADLQLVYGEKHSTIQKLQQHINKLEETLDGRLIPDIEAIGPAGVKIVAQARESSPVAMKPSTSGLRAIAFIMSIMSGVVIAFGIEHFKQTFSSPRDIETHLNVPLLGSIPKTRGRKNSTLNDNFSPDAKVSEAYQHLSNQLYFYVKERHFKSIVIINTDSAEVAPSVVANLSYCLSHTFNGNTGLKVLLIDANVSSSSRNHIADADNKIGLTDVLNGRVSFEDSIQSLDSNLNIITSGNTSVHPLALLETSVMSDVIKMAEESYDLVFIYWHVHVKNLSDMLAVSALTDGVVIVLNEGETRRLVIKDIINRLEEKKSNVIGVILNNRKFPLPDIVYKLT
ncbi:MAG: hypothetical protein C4526_03775 [Nitrospiraceae bacterium]|nr:MAG: hypothetical protein C4526_03775 [Nitrospiraceae bacterium]